MFIYVFMLFLLVLGCISDLYNFKRRNIVFLFNFFLIFLIVIFRYGIGTDYAQYETLFNNSKSLLDIDTLSYFYDQESNVEFGYLFFESFIKTFTDNFSIFIIFYNAVLFLILFVAINRNRYLNIQLFLFFTLFHIYYISGHRQAMAMVIFLYNIKNILNRNTFRFFFFCLLSILFHTSSILFIVFYLFSFVKLKRWIIICILFSSFLIIKFDVLGSIIEWAYLNLRDISYIFSRLHFYYFNQYGGEDVNIFNYIKVAVLAALAIYFYDRVDYRLSYLILAYFLSFYWLSYAGGIAFRVADAFFIGIMYYLPILLDNLNKLEKNIVITLFIIYGAIVFLRILYVHIFFGVDKFLPYRTIFENVIL